MVLNFLLKFVATGEMLCFFGKKKQIRPMKQQHLAKETCECCIVLRISQLKI